jgi:hypothetical protein
MVNTQNHTSSEATLELLVEQSQATRAKRRDFGFSIARPPFPKKGKSGQSLGQFQKRGGNFTPGGNSGGSRQVGGGGLLRCRGRTN